MTTETPAWRGDTADHQDPARSWTVQTGVPFPAIAETTKQRFHPDELPDADVLAEFGGSGPVIPEILIDAEYETQPPTDSYPVDHPARDKYRGQSTVKEMLDKKAEHDALVEKAAADAEASANDAAPAVAAAPEPPKAVSVVTPPNAPPTPPAAS